MMIGDADAAYTIALEPPPKVYVDVVTDLLYDVNSKANDSKIKDAIDNILKSIALTKSFRKIPPTVDRRKVLQLLEEFGEALSRHIVSFRARSPEEVTSKRVSTKTFTADILYVENFFRNTHDVIVPFTGGMFKDRLLLDMGRRAAEEIHRAKVYSIGVYRIRLSPKQALALGTGVIEDKTYGFSREGVVRKYYDFAGRVHSVLFPTYREFVKALRKKAIGTVYEKFFDDPLGLSEKELYDILYKMYIIARDVSIEFSDNAVVIEEHSEYDEHEVEYVTKVFKDSLGNTVVMTAPSPISHVCDAYPDEKVYGGVVVNEVSMVPDSAIRVKRALGLGFNIAGDYIAWLKDDYPWRSFYLQVRDSVVIGLVNGSKAKLGKGLYEVAVPYGVTFVVF
ncbi:hypothetical protein [Pyrococcus kukulkanii]|uniref:Uncharacterized protein n=1 Tax=Pyrococcus kukulkanii TaxID=1609559 RepID=A0ABV4T680_9EURY